MSNEKLNNPYVDGPFTQQTIKWILWGMAAAVCIITLLLIKQCNRPLPPAPTVVPIAVIKDSVKAAKERAQHTIDSLTLTVRKFRTLADSGKAALAQLKARASLLNKFTGSGRFIPRVAGDTKTVEFYTQKTSENIHSSNDYAGGNPAEIIAEQAQIIKDQDSACTVTIEALEGLSQTKDGIITAKDTLLAAMDRQLALALNNQASLQTYTKQLRKAAKRARFGRGFWRTAAVALAGIVVYISVK